MALLGSRRKPGVLASFDHVDAAVGRDPRAPGPRVTRT